MGRSHQENWNEAAFRRVLETWEQKTGQLLDQEWDSTIAQWTKDFRLSLLIDAIVEVVAQARRNDVSPKISNVPRFATALRADERVPGMLACYKARGRISKKFLYVDPNMMITVLAAAMHGGMSASAMNKAIDDNETLEGLCIALGVGSLEYEEMFGGRPIDQKEEVYSRRSARVASLAILSPQD